MSQDAPADFSIDRIIAHGRREIIRVEFRDGLKILARGDIELADFAKALTGQAVLAAFSTPGAGI